ncbi:hypothetical protein ACTNDP_22785, partial [Paenibacillus barengoltzii]|uniref:hypothetical protein n=1 Tax=Paenibacillus barengoltzii TaxID=343517 RepID=UPI003F8B84A7
MVQEAGEKFIKSRRHDHFNFLAVVRRDSLPSRFGQAVNISRMVVELNKLESSPTRIYNGNKGEDSVMGKAKDEFR